MTQEPSTAVKLYGTDEPPAPIHRFRRGPLTFDLEAGKLRYIRIGGIEALRSIAFVVRGPGWESPAPRISGLDAEERADALRLGFKAAYETAGGRLEVTARIEAADNGLTFEAEALALTDFTTARTSFCILHPIAGVAGAPLEVTRPDESVERASFPKDISAHQPFMNIRALSHEVGNGIRATVRMEGDVWEMEDQRNWTDASFKTYGRPRDLPWPYTIPKGERVVQRVLLSFAGGVPAAARAEPEEVAITLDDRPGGRLPAVELAVSPEEAGNALDAAGRLAAAPAELVCWFEHGVHGAAELAAYAALARRLGSPIGLELILPCRSPLERELAEVAALLREAAIEPASLRPIQAPMTRWVLKPPEELGLPGFAALYRAARKAFPRAALGAGVLSNFTELNIDRPDLAGADFVTHCTAAVIHEPDDRSVMETLETLPHIFGSVRAIAAGLAYHLGPSAIGMRYNPYGNTTDPNRDNRRVAFARQDPRQRGLFGAAFALGYLARAAEAGLDGVCFGAPTGPFGLLYRKTDHPQPWFDTQAPGAAYPLYHVIMAVAAADRAPRLPVRSGAEKRVLGFGYGDKDGGRVAWLANLTAEPVALRLEGPGIGQATVKQIDTASFVQAALDAAGFGAAPGRPLPGGRLSLSPYAVAEIRRSR